MKFVFVAALIASIQTLDQDKQSSIVLDRNNKHHHDHGLTGVDIDLYSDEVVNEDGENEYDR